MNGECARLVICAALDFLVGEDLVLVANAVPPREVSQPELKYSTVRLVPYVHGSA